MFRSVVNRRFISRHFGRNPPTVGPTTTSTTPSSRIPLFTSIAGGSARGTATTPTGGEGANGAASSKPSSQQQGQPHNNVVDKSKAATVSMEAYNNGTLPTAPPASGTTAQPTASTNGGEGENAAELSTAERRYWLKTLLNAATTRFLMTGTDNEEAAPNSELKKMQQEAKAPAVTKKAEPFTEEVEVDVDPALRKEREEHKLYVSQMTAPPMRLRRTEERGAPGLPGTRAGSKVEQQIRRELRTRQPATSVNDLLNYNKKWSSTIRRIDPTYFADLAKQQSPKFLWIGCADSRVPANQILGLAPGEVFVHRNVANIVSRSDLNCLSVVQFGVEHLRVEQLLVVGHYGCGGVTAAYKGLTLGLVDNWVSNVADIKHRNEAALARVPEEERVDCLCDLNAITQALNVAESNVVQAHWRVFRDEQEDDDDGGSEGEASSATAPTTEGGSANSANNTARGDQGSSADQKPAKLQTKQPLRIHGWCYGLKDGLVHPLVDFGPYDDPRAKAEEAIESAVKRRLEEYERRNRKPIVEGL